MFQVEFFVKTAVPTDNLPALKVKLPIIRVVLTTNDDGNYPFPPKFEMTDSAIARFRQFKKIKGSIPVSANLPAMFNTYNNKVLVLVIANDWNYLTTYLKILSFSEQSEIFCADASNSTINIFVVNPLVKAIRDVKSAKKFISSFNDCTKSASVHSNYCRANGDLNEEEFNKILEPEPLSLSPSLSPSPSQPPPPFRYVPPHPHPHPKPPLLIIYLKNITFCVRIEPGGYERIILPPSHLDSNPLNNITSSPFILKDPLSFTHHLYISD
ncbi:hypothetical protein AGLY_003085 [Aphis glycines]|uniref:Uncharacterized protein n=1 Tax=Aphis glycines TaxID=307491 RepID=A0A6G0U273_APHGL|nr:hypothetical protein AGLY_003085 [Aphis glycines]